MKSTCVAAPRRRFLFCLLIGHLLFHSPEMAIGADGAEELRGGTNYMPTAVYSQAEDAVVLALFEGLRVADVSDGMDKAGLHSTGLMDPAIAPLWKDTEEYRHRIIGVAVTVRYVPTQLPPAGHRATEAFDEWVSDWYQKRSSEPFVPLLRDGSVLVIEEHGKDTGTIGSNNILSWKLRGCVGVVTSATARDTDEIITEQIPLYFRGPGRGIRPGRNEVESVNRPIVCGGVLVMPGDVVVADGDGVIVVPRTRAKEVADYSRETLEGDKNGRRRLYERLGLPLDKSVK